MARMIPSENNGTRFLLSEHEPIGFVCEVWLMAEEYYPPYLDFIIQIPLDCGERSWELDPSVLDYIKRKVSASEIASIVSSALDEENRKLERDLAL